MSQNSHLDPTYVRWRADFGTFMEDMDRITKSANFLANEHYHGRLTDLRGLATAAMLYNGYDDGLMVLEAKLARAHQKRLPPPAQA